MLNDCFGQHPDPWEESAEPVELSLERAIHTQTNVIICRLTTFESMRQMTRQEFRELLRQRLQEFGDAIMRAWEERWGRGAP